MKNAATQLADFERFARQSLDEVLAAPADRAANERRVIDLAREAARRVPAYRTILREHGIDPTAITSLAQLPLLTKESYIRRFGLPDLCWDGSCSANDMIAVSSGSTGQPTFWLRSMSDELEVARRFEQVFVDSFGAADRRTLAVVCFVLGTWVGGMFTASCCRLLAAKGLPVTVVTPGNNKAEIFRVVRELAPHFDQTVLLGYPPFVKDVIDSGQSEGIDWPAMCVRIVLAGEVFSEEWRTLVLKRAGSGDPLLHSASLYGTADAGVLGNESPISIGLRRFMSARPDAAKSIFGESRLPTLVQYDPASRFFEVVDGTLAVSGSNGIPLIRYHIADRGGLFAFDELLDRAREAGFDPRAALGDRAPLPRRLPFVYLFGRADFTVSYYGANIYPENVTVALEQPELCEMLTGKFVLEVLEDEHRDCFLQVTAELGRGVGPSPDLADSLARAIVEQLLLLNSEFAHYVPAHRRLPVIRLRAHGDPDYFPPAGKHRYTRRAPSSEERQ